MNEPKNQMEALIRTIEARGKVYWDHTEIDNKALDDVQTVFDGEVKKLEEENKRLKSVLRKVLSAIEYKFRHEEGIEEEIEAWYRDFGLEKEQGDE